MNVHWIKRDRHFTIKYSQVFSTFLALFSWKCYALQILTPFVIRLFCWGWSLFVDTVIKIDKNIIFSLQITKCSFRFLCNWFMRKTHGSIKIEQICEILHYIPYLTNCFRVALSYGNLQIDHWHFSSCAIFQSVPFLLLSLYMWRYFPLLDNSTAALNYVVNNKLILKLIFKFKPPNYDSRYILNFSW